MAKMTELTIPKLPVGMHRDEASKGLYLRVNSTTSRSWVARFMIDGKPREMGLGPFPEITLKRARERAGEARTLKAEGVDPLEAKRAALAARKAEAAKSVTFRQAAESYIAAHKAGWGDKHAGQWAATLETFAYPVLGSLPVASITTDEVLKVLEPIWHDKTPTATRLRGRIETVLAFAKTRGWRTGENPAAWAGHLEFSLPAKGDIKSRSKKNGFMSNGLAWSSV
jgi:hypothetical protein